MTHQMTLEAGDAVKGVWQCRDCDYRFVLDVEAVDPEDFKTVIQRGERVAHAGGTAPPGLTLSVQTAAAQ